MSIKRKPVAARKKVLPKAPARAKAVSLPPLKIRPKSLLAMAFETLDKGQAPDMPARLPKIAAKPRAWRSKDYRQLVSMLPCSFVGCAAEAPSQAAHRNEGKGMGVKVTDAWLFSACPEHHAMVDQGQNLTNAQRRQLVDTAILRTFSMLLNRGWLFTASPADAEKILPAALPQLAGDDLVDLAEQRLCGGWHD